jgi:hypothetical protein
MSRTNSLTEQDERTVAGAEADLVRLLSVEPSDDFAARVRQRINETSRQGRAWWIWPAVAVAAALVIVVALATPSGRGTQSASGQSGSAARDVVLHYRAPAHDDDVPAPPKEKARVFSSKPPASVARAPESEVLIDPSVADAVRRLALGARNTLPASTNEEELPIGLSDPAALPVPEPLIVPELVLKPADETGGQ